MGIAIPLQDCRAFWLAVNNLSLPRVVPRSCPRSCPNPSRSGSSQPVEVRVVPTRRCPDRPISLSSIYVSTFGFQIHDTAIFGVQFTSRHVVLNIGLDAYYFGKLVLYYVKDLFSQLGHSLPQSVITHLCAFLLLAHHLSLLSRRCQEGHAEDRTMFIFGCIHFQVHELVYSLPITLLLQRWG